MILLQGITPKGRAWDAQQKLAGLDPQVIRARRIVARVEYVIEWAQLLWWILAVFVLLPALVSAGVSAIIRLGADMMGRNVSFLLIWAIVFVVTAIPLPLIRLYNEIEAAAKKSVSA